jgi:predicted dehydrogenase
MPTTQDLPAHASSSWAQTRRLKLALVGCGAVTEHIHLPTAMASAQFDVSALVDTSLGRAQALADRHQVHRVLVDYRSLAGEVDAAIVALPNYLHASVTANLLRQGIHVLVEKPMALSTHEADEMIAAALEGGAVLAVGLDFRFFDANRFVKQLLVQQILGAVTSFELRQGSTARWPAATDAGLRKQSAGGGVLTDLGVHFLDLILWWLGPYASVEYYDDAMGGVETNCLLHLTLQSGAMGTVELSRTRNLRNSWVIQGDRGTLEVGSWGYDPTIQLRLGNETAILSGRVVRKETIAHTMLAVFGRQLEDFAAAISARRDPFVPGTAGRRTVELIEACYAAKQPLQYPWMSPPQLGTGIG